MIPLSRRSASPSTLGAGDLQALFVLDVFLYTERVESLWSRLEAWVQTNAPNMSLRLRPPATEARIAAAELELGLTFPADFRRSLLVHDGQEHDPSFDWMPGCNPLATLDAIVEQWKDEQDRAQDGETDDAKVVLDGRFRNVLWHSRRIPIAGTQYWDQDNTYLDLVPGPTGTIGQLVTMTSECDFTVLGTSFRQALERYVGALETGNWPPRDTEVFHAADSFVDLFEDRQTLPIPSPPPVERVAPPGRAAKPKPKPAAKAKPKVAKPKAKPAKPKPKLKARTTAAKAKPKAKPRATAKAKRKPKR